MEYVILRATHPSWLTMHLPNEVALLAGFGPDASAIPNESRSISFLSRGTGLVRVVATYPAREALAVETLRNRLLATARPTERLLFSLPATVAQHLRLEVTSRPPRRLRGTDDTVVWFVPAPEYYAFRRAEAEERPWADPSGFGVGHVYLAKSLHPFPRELSQLAETESRIEQEEWRPGIEALQRVARVRRG